MIDYAVSCFTTPHYLLTIGQQCVAALLMLPFVMVFIAVTSWFIIREIKP